MRFDILLDGSFKQRLIIFRGISGSGKTTLARDWVSMAAQYRCLVGSEFIGTMLYGYPVTDRPMCEEAIMLCKIASIRTLLEHGYSVVNDDANIVHAQFARIRDMGRVLPVETHVIDLRTTHLEQCVRNDRLRGDKSVGRKAILRQTAIMNYEMRFDD
jgi:predicted kinase